MITHEDVDKFTIPCALSVRQCTEVSGRWLSSHRWRQHTPTLLDRHGDMCCSTVTQNFRQLVKSAD